MNISIINNKLRIFKLNGKPLLCRILKNNEKEKAKQIYFLQNMVKSSTKFS